LVPVNAQSSLFLLRAAIPLAGRSFPIYECVHDRDSCPRQQNRLLDALECLLPEGCVPTLVTDAGFRRPWFQIAALGGYVLHLAGLHARDSGEARRYQSNTVRTKAVLSVWRVGLEYLRRHAGALPRHVLIVTERLLCDEVHRQARGLG
jgi:hypothetical protein